jgi:hypothetical protein
MRRVMFEKDFKDKYGSDFQVIILSRKKHSQESCRCKLPHTHTQSSYKSKLKLSHPSSCLEGNVYLTQVLLVKVCPFYIATPSLHQA